MAKRLSLLVAVIALMAGTTWVSAQTNWEKYPDNPVLNLGSPGQWDDFTISEPYVRYEGGIYKMWYSGHDGANVRIGYATSSDGVTWTKYAGNPVLNLGSPGQWDDVYAYNPTVLFDNGVYKMWYSGYDGSNTRIGYATSLDGVTWTKYAGNPVLDLGSPGQWDDYRVYTPDIHFKGGLYKMWYSGHDGANIRIGYATSSDGVTWTKYAGNPVLNLGSPDQWDDLSVYFPRVLYEGGIYKMWYSAYHGSNVRIGYATSPNGVTWTK